MNESALDFWGRANKSLSTAEKLCIDDPDASVSRSYYAAFYAVSAYFAIIGMTFVKHSAIEAAVHRDLVKTGIWNRELGAEYSDLVNLRYTGDYGGKSHVSTKEATVAVQNARRILEAVCSSNPDVFPL